MYNKVPARGVDSLSRLDLFGIYLEMLVFGLESNLVLLLRSPFAERRVHILRGYTINIKQEVIDVLVKQKINVEC